MQKDRTISRRAFILLTSGFSLSLLLSCHRNSHWVANDKNLKKSFQAISERFMMEHKPDLDRLETEIEAISKLNEAEFSKRLWEDISNSLTIRLDNWLMPRSLVLLSTAL